MALPSGITPKVVTIGIASFFDGTLAEGSVTITAPSNVVHTPTNRPIFSSQIQQRFVDGVATFTLCPTDADGLNNKSWTYKANIVVSGALVQPDPIYFVLPQAGPNEIDLDGLVTVPSSAGVPISATVVTSVNGQTGDVTIAASAPADASTTVKGIVELATSGETTTGTDTVRAVTPAGLKAVTDALAAGYTTVSRQVQALADGPIDPAPPTITAQTSASQLASATTTLTGTLITPADAANKARYNAFRLEPRPWTGAVPMYGPRPPHRGDNGELDPGGLAGSLWSIDFDFYGDAFEIPVVSTTQIRVVTDGAYASVTGTQGITNGNFTYIKVQYASTKYRRIRIETGVDATNSFPGGWVCGIKIKTGQAMYPPSMPNTKRFALVHDSFGLGGTATVADLRGYSATLARLLGFTDYVNLAYGGSGFTLGGTGATQKFGYRIDDLVAAQPQYLFLPGSVNDYANRATTLPAEALAFYQACKAQLPNTKILAAGAVAMVAANGDAITAVLKTAAQTAGIDFIDTTGWTTGLPAAFIDSDNYHPTVAGHEWIARRFAPYLRDAWKLPA